MTVIKVYITIVALLLLGCGTPDSVRKEIKIEGFAQGTTYHISYLSTENKSYERSIDSLLIEIDNSLSTYQERSTISRFNNCDSIAKSDSMFKDVFAISKDVYQVTEGAFNPAIAPIVNMWGFGYENTFQLDSSKIDSLLAFTDFDKVLVKEAYIIKLEKGIKLDFNGVAQGYSVDVLSRFLELKGIDNYMVEVGGELRVSGNNINDTLWRIGIDRPLINLEQREIEAIINLDNKSVATSGNYRKLKEKNGVKYSHTINPKTGYPILHNLLSATVIADNCGYADAYATAFMVLGLEKSKEILLSSNKLEALLIYSSDDGSLETFVTAGIKNHVALNPVK